MKLKYWDNPVVPGRGRMDGAGGGGGREVQGERLGSGSQMISV